MRVRKLLQQAAEDGELRRERGGVRGAQGGAVGGEVRRGQARAVEGGEADGFTGHGGGGGGMGAGYCLGSNVYVPTAFMGALIVDFW